MDLPSIYVTPFSSMVDQHVHISICGLEARSKVTLRCHMREGKYSFEAHAHFIADLNGRLSLSRDASIGGSFEGVRPMGLFSCMKPSPGQRRGIRYFKKDVTKPLVYTLSLHNTHIDVNGLQNDVPLTRCQIQRWYLADNVERKLIRHGNIRGSLLKPKGLGPFPGIIDMFGHAGGLMDFRAALLSSHGFTVLALALYNYDDLTNDINDMTLEYCDEAVIWFCNEPYIKPGGIGVCGVSFGGTISLLMASRFPEKVAGVVAISSPIAMIKPPLKHRGKKMPYLDFDRTKLKLMPDGSLYAKGCYRDVREAPEETRIKIEKIRKILFIVGEDDHDFDATLHAREAVKRFQAYGRNTEDCQVLSYPGTGHFIEPPYRPVTNISFHRVMGTLLDWGGNVEEQSEAQIDAWNQLLRFFNENLKSIDSKL